MQTGIDRRLDEETLLRLGYIPFCIGELVWDYADTVITLCAMMKIDGTKKMSRAIRGYRREYLQERAEYVTAAQRDNEVSNGLVYEEAVSDITGQMLVNVKADIRAQYPDLSDDYLQLLVATHQCDVLCKALIRYVETISAKVEGIVGHKIGCVLPRSVFGLSALIGEYAGDKPLSARLTPLLDKYIETLAVQMALIKLDPGQILNTETDNNG